MIRYKEECVDDKFIEESRSLLENHWEEIAMYKDKIIFDPDYEVYKELEVLGKLSLISARDEGKLIGYYISFVNKHPHYRNDIFAVNDILFIDKKYRGGTAAYRMFKFAEKVLTKKGVSVMVLSMKAAHPFEGLCTALGMDKHEISFSKYIGET